VRGARLPPTINLRHHSVARHREQPRTANRAPCLKTTRVTGDSYQWS